MAAESYIGFKRVTREGGGGYWVDCHPTPFQLEFFKFVRVFDQKITFYSVFTRLQAMSTPWHAAVLSPRISRVLRTLTPFYDELALVVAPNVSIFYANSAVCQINYIQSGCSFYGQGGRIGGKLVVKSIRRRLRDDSVMRWCNLMTASSVTRQLSDQKWSIFRSSERHH